MSQDITLPDGKVIKYPDWYPPSMVERHLQQNFGYNPNQEEGEMTVDDVTDPRANTLREIMATEGQEAARRQSAEFKGVDPDEFVERGDLRRAFDAFAAGGGGMVYAPIAKTLDAIGADDSANALRRRMDYLTTTSQVLKDQEKTEALENVWSNIGDAWQGHGSENLRDVMGDTALGVLQESGPTATGLLYGLGAMGAAAPLGAAGAATRAGTAVASRGGVVAKGLGGVIKSLPFTMPARAAESAMEAESELAGAFMSGYSEDRAREIANKTFWGNETLSGWDSAQAFILFAGLPKPLQKVVQKIPPQTLTRMTAQTIIGLGRFLGASVVEGQEEAYQAEVSEWARENQLDAKDILAALSPYHGQKEHPMEWNLGALSSAATVAPTAAFGRISEKLKAKPGFAGEVEIWNVEQQAQLKAALREERQGEPEPDLDNMDPVTEELFTMPPLTETDPQPEEGHYYLGAEWEELIPQVRADIAAGEMESPAVLSYRQRLALGETPPAALVLGPQAETESQQEIPGTARTSTQGPSVVDGQVPGAVGDRKMSMDLGEEADPEAEAETSDDRIVEAVINVSGKEYSGPTHGHAIDEAIKAGDLIRADEGYLVDLDGNDVAHTGQVDLFRTKSGRIINRFQASQEFGVASAEAAGLAKPTQQTLPLEEGETREGAPRGEVPTAPVDEAAAARAERKRPKSPKLPEQERLGLGTPERGVRYPGPPGNPPGTKVARKAAQQAAPQQDQKTLDNLTEEEQAIVKLTRELGRKPKLPEVRDRFKELGLTIKPKEMKAALKAAGNLGVQKPVDVTTPEGRLAAVQQLRQELGRDPTPREVLDMDPGLLDVTEEQGNEIWEEEDTAPRKKKLLDKARGLIEESAQMEEQQAETEEQEEAPKKPRRSKLDRMADEGGSPWGVPSLEESAEQSKVARAEAAKAEAEARKAEAEAKKAEEEAELAKIQREEAVGEASKKLESELEDAQLEVAAKYEEQRVAAERLAEEAKAERESAMEEVPWEECPFTKEGLELVFPGAKITPTRGGAIVERVDHPVTEVHAVDVIGTVEEAAAAYGLTVEEVQQRRDRGAAGVRGLYSPREDRVVIELSRGILFPQDMADAGTLAHEDFHLAMQYGLNERTKKQILKKYWKQALDYMGVKEKISFEDAWKNQDGVVDGNPVVAFQRRWYGKRKVHSKQTKSLTNANILARAEEIAADAYAEWNPNRGGLFKRIHEWLTELVGMPTNDRLMSNVYRRQGEYAAGEDAAGAGYQFGDREQRAQIKLPELQPVARPSQKRREAAVQLNAAEKQLVKEAAENTTLATEEDIIAAIKSRLSEWPRTEKVDGQRWTKIEVVDIKVREGRGGKPSIKLTLKPQPWQYTLLGKRTRMPARDSKEWPSYRKKVIARLKKGIIDEFNNIVQNSSQQEFAEILAARTWYTDSARELRARFGAFGEIMADLIGAFSPNQAVDYNYWDAINALESYTKGKYDGELGVLWRWIQDGNPPGKFADAHRDALIVRDSGKLFGTNSTLGMLALLGSWRAIKAGDAGKAKAFTNAVIGRSGEAVVDTWIGRALDRIMGKDRIPSVIKKGITGSWLSDGVYEMEEGLDGQYGLASDAFREAFTEIEKTSPGMLPDAAGLQAVLWLQEKRIWEAHGWSRRAKEGRDTLINLILEDNFSTVTAGITTFQNDQATPPGSRDFNESLGVAMFRLESELKANPEVKAIRTEETLGVFGEYHEPSIDIELVATPKFDPKNFLRTVIRIGREHNQEMVFVSKVLQPGDSIDNARPGLTIHFEQPIGPNNAWPIALGEVFRRNSGLTFQHDARSGLATGVTLQWLPEYDVLYDEAKRSEVLADPTVVAGWQAQAVLDMADLMEAVQNNPLIQDVQLQLFDTIVGTEYNYDDLAPADPRIGPQTGGRKIRFGVDLRHHLTEAARSVGQQGLAGPEVSDRVDGGSRFSLSLDESQALRQGTGEDGRFWYFSARDHSREGLKREFAGSGAAGAERSRYRFTENGQLDPDSAAIHLYTPGARPEPKVVSRSNFLHRIQSNLKLMELGTDDALNIMKEIQDSRGIYGEELIDAFIEEIKKLGYDGMVDTRRGVAQVFRDIQAEEIAEATLMTPEERRQYTNKKRQVRLYQMAAYEPIVNSTFFEGWFGDSTVVDEFGNPKVLFHGTRPVFDDMGVLDPDHAELGVHVGTEWQANAFAGGATEAQLEQTRQGIERMGVGPGQADRVYPIYVRMEKPLRLKDYGSWVWLNIKPQLLELGVMSEAEVAEFEAGRSRVGDGVPSFADVRRLIQSLGYDGIVYLNRVEVFAETFEDSASNSILSRLLDAELNGSLMNREGRAMSDEEVMALLPEARDSYIVFERDQMKSALGTDPLFADSQRLQLTLNDLPVNAATTSNYGISASATNPLSDSLQRANQILNEYKDHPALSAMNARAHMQSILRAHFLGDESQWDDLHIVQAISYSEVYEDARRAREHNGLAENADWRALLKKLVAKSGMRHNPAQTSTEAFKRWFKKSFAVDENGDPLVLFHGTAATFEEFSKKYRGRTTGAPSAGQGFFFTNDPESANEYVKYSSDELFGSDFEGQMEAVYERLHEEFSQTPDGKRLRERVESTSQTFLEEEARVKEWLDNHPEVLERFWDRIKDDFPSGADWYKGDHFPGWALSRLKDFVNSNYPTKVEDAIWQAFSDTNNLGAIEDFKDYAQKARSAEKEHDTAREAYVNPLAMLESAALMGPTGQYGGQVYPVYLSLQNPLISDDKSQGYRETTYYDLTQQAKAAGHDGVIIRNTFDGSRRTSGEDVYIVFEPEQVKSATGNRGTFDATDSNVRHSLNITDPTPQEQRAIDKARREAEAELKEFADMIDNPGDAERFIAERIKRKLLEDGIAWAGSNKLLQISLHGDDYDQLDPLTRWFMAKDRAFFMNSVEARKFQNELKVLVGHKSRIPNIRSKMEDSGWVYDKNARDWDRAIHIYIDLKREPEAYDKFYAELTAEQKEIVDMAMRIENGNAPAGIRDLADRIERSYHQHGIDTLDAGIITNVLDNYVHREWKKKKGDTGQAGFGTATHHAKQRKLMTILEGWAQGLELQLEGATNNLMAVKDEIARVKADRNLIAEGRRTRIPSDDPNAPMLITHNPPAEMKDQYTEIKHPNFTYWMPTRVIEGTVTTAKKSMARTQTMETMTFAVYRAMTEAEIARSLARNPNWKQRAVKTFSHRDPVVAREMAQRWMEQNTHPGVQYFMRDRRQQWEKQRVFVYGDMGKKIEKILTKMDKSKAPVWAAMLKINSIAKSWILATSFFHHMAFLRSFYLGTPGTGFTADVRFDREGNVIQGEKMSRLRLRDAYVAGNHMMDNLNEELLFLVENGLTLGAVQDFEESPVFESIYKDSNPALQKIRELRARQTTFLFKRFGAGLKAQAALIEFQKMLKKDRTSDPVVIAQRVAALINEDFGGLHLDRMGVGDRARRWLRLLLLAPDWTGSNVLTLKRMIFAGEGAAVPPAFGGDKALWERSRGDAKHRAMYRAFWGGVLGKALIGTVVMNMILAGFDDDEDRWASRVHEFKNNKKNLRWLGVDITPMYIAASTWMDHLPGVDIKPDDRRRYFSVAGHFADPLKWATNLTKASHNKGSPLYRAMYGMYAGVDWKGDGFTNIDEWLGTDDKGYYKSTGPGYRPGDPKGGQHKFHFTKRGGDAGPLGWGQLPVWLGHTAISQLPIQIQEALHVASGERDAVDGMWTSIGVHTSRGSMSRFEFTAKKIRDAEQHLMGLRSEGSTQEAVKFRKETPELRALGRLKGVERAISKYNRRIRAYEKSKTLSKSQQKSKISEVEDKIKEIEDNFMAWYLENFNG